MSTSQRMIDAKVLLPESYTRKAIDAVIDDLVVRIDAATLAAPEITSEIELLANLANALYLVLNIEPGAERGNIPQRYIPFNTALDAAKEAFRKF